MRPNPFTDHPATVGETYGEHLVHASGFGFAMIRGGLVCLIHAVLPFLFEKSGSRIITALHDRMVTNRIAAKNRARAEEHTGNRQAVTAHPIPF